MKKTMKRWWVYQNLSNPPLGLRRFFSTANHTITPSETVMIHPVIPVPVAKLRERNSTKTLVVVFFERMIARFAKFHMCATIWTRLKKTMDHAVAMWNLMLSSKGTISFSAVWRRREMKFRQTGKRMKATSM
jgi:hypothetical protein